MARKKIKQKNSQTAQQGTATRSSLLQKHNFLFFIERGELGITKVHLNIVKKLLAQSSGDTLYLILHTIGGDVYSAVRIMRFLQSKFKEIKVIIPDFAYSSGTIMSLGGDEIYMSVDSTLGPLDLPVEHPSDGCTISSLDITNTIQNLASICTSIGIKIYQQLRNDSDLRLGKRIASQLAFNTASKIINPIVNKIDPFNLQKGFRVAKIGLYYAIDLLVSRMMKNDVDQAFKTSHSLVNNYPSHGYEIFRDEAKDTLKLKIFELEQLHEWGKIESKFEILKKDYTKYIKFEIL